MIVNEVFQYLGRLLARLIFPLFHFLPIRRLDIIKIYALRLHGCKVGEGASFSPGIFILRGKNTVFGDNVSIGVDCRIFDIGTVLIGDAALVSHNVTIIAGNHGKDLKRTGYAADIIIGSNVWIGASVTIVGPVMIGDNAVIGANSFVKCNVPSNMIYAGVPAKCIGNVVDHE